MGGVQPITPLRWKQKGLNEQNAEMALKVVSRMAQCMYKEVDTPQPKQSLSATICDKASKPWQVVGVAKRWGIPNTCV